MAITITTLQGTNSLSADRITINDNFKINTDAINNILGVVDTTIGLIDNTGLGGSNQTIKTEGIVLTTSGVDVQGGNVSISSGSFKATTNGSFLQLGADNSKIIDTIITVGAVNKHFIGATGFDGIQISEMTTAEITAITSLLTTTSPKILTFDSTLKKLKFWNGTAFETITSAV
tara:strand:- start:2182 stop:2706 length:525 start_codon:yes stop_codon:yes gene_type:complete